MVYAPYPIHQLEGQFDLAVQVVEGNKTLDVEFRYATDLFEAATVERMLAQYLMLLGEIVADPDRPVRRPSDTHSGRRIRAARTAQRDIMRCRPVPVSSRCRHGGRGPERRQRCDYGPRRDADLCGARAPGESARPHASSRRSGEGIRRRSLPRSYVFPAGRTARRAEDGRLVRSARSLVSAGAPGLYAPRRPRALRRHRAAVCGVGRSGRSSPRPGRRRSDAARCAARRVPCGAGITGRSRLHHLHVGLQRTAERRRDRASKPRQLSSCDAPRARDRARRCAARGDDAIVRHRRARVVFSARCGCASRDRHAGRGYRWRAARTADDGEWRHDDAGDSRHLAPADRRRLGGQRPAYGTLRRREPDARSGGGAVNPRARPLEHVRPHGNHDLVHRASCFQRESRCPDRTSDWQYDCLCTWMRQEGSVPSAQPASSASAEQGSRAGIEIART